MDVKNTGALIALLSCSCLQAQVPTDLHILAGASLGYSRYDFPQKLDHELTFPVYQLNSALAYKQLYLSLNLSDTLADEDVSEEEDLGSASRYDHDISLGYQLSPSLGVFTGYKIGQTDIDFYDRNEGLKRDEYYRQEGFFVGGSFSHKFQQAGKLSLSLAYADLNATDKFKQDVETAPDSDSGSEFDDLTGKIRGSTQGFSYGIKWSIPIAGQLLYYASYKVNDYQQNIKVAGVRYDNIDESISNFSMGVVHVW